MVDPRRLRTLRTLLTGVGCALLLSCAGGARSALEAPVPPIPDRLDRDAERWVERTLQSLTPREEVAQLVFQWIPGSYASTTSAAFREIEGWVVDEKIGGLLISIGLPHSYAAKLNALQRRAAVPLLVTADSYSAYVLYGF